VCSNQQGSQCGTFIWADEIDNGGGAGGSSGWEGGGAGASSGRGGGGAGASSGWGGGSGGGGRGQGGGRGKYLNLLYPSLSYRGIHFFKMIF